MLNFVKLMEPGGTRVISEENIVNMLKISRYISRFDELEIFLYLDISKETIPPPISQTYI